MKNTWRAIPEFWRSAILGAVTLAVLAATESATNLVFALPHGRFPAAMIEIMRSQAVLENPGVTGYYERLFTETRRLPLVGTAPNRIMDSSFRIVRMKPNLKGLSNSFGLAGPEYTLYKPPNTRRVALLGDSLTQGLGVAIPSNYCSLLDRRLNETRSGANGQRIEIVNFALAGYQLTQIFDTAVEDVPRFEPDVYALALTELSVYRPWDEHIIEVLRMGIDMKYDFLRDTIREAGVEPADGPLALFGKLAPYRVRTLRTLLSQMKSLAEAHHATFVVMLVPAVEDGDLTRNRFAGIPELLKSLGIVTVDVLDTFDGVPDRDALRIYPTDVHPNKRGHEMIFQNLYAKFRAQPDAWRDLMGPAAEAF